MNDADNVQYSWWCRPNNLRSSRTERERQGQRQRERQTDRQANRQTDRQTDRQGEGESENIAIDFGGGERPDSIFPHPLVWPIEEAAHFRVITYFAFSAFNLGDSRINAFALPSKSHLRHASEPSRYQSAKEYKKNKKSFLFLLLRR